MIKLNLGCIINKLPGYINVDFNPEANPEMLMNLDKDTFDLKDNSVSEVVARHTMEHLQNPLFCLNELYRVCHNGAKIFITVPHGFSCFHHQDLTHKTSFTYRSLDYVNVDDSGEYTFSMHGEYGHTKFKVKPMFVPAKWHRRIGLGWLFNKFPDVYEGYLIGLFPAREIVFELEVYKKATHKTSKENQDGRN